MVPSLVVEVELIVMMESSVSETWTIRFSELPLAADMLVVAGSVLDWGVGGSAGIVKDWDVVSIPIPSSFLEQLRVRWKNSLTISSGLCFLRIASLWL